MASPVNPFAALHQTDGAANSTARGRGGPFRGATSFQPRGASAFQPRGGNSNAPRDPNTRGRGRGRGAPATRAGRGNARGAAAASNTWRANKPEQQTASAQSASSPFAQLKQTQPSASLSTAPTPQQQQKPTFSGFGRGSPSPFGAPSTRGGTSVNATRDPRKQPAPQPTNGVTGDHVPVEDTSATGNYNDRYEQVRLVMFSVVLNAYALKIAQNLPCQATGAGH